MSSYRDHGSNADFDFSNSKPTGEEKLTEWGQLSIGKTLGKRGVINFTPIFFGGGIVQNLEVNLLEVRGHDRNALQLALTLSPPRLVIAPPPLDLQAATGEMDNIGLFNLGAGFAGFANPICKVEWGIGGVSNSVDADFLNGLVLNLSASWVRVIAFIDAQVAATTAAALYVVSAFLGPGNARANNAQKSKVNFPIGNIFPTPTYAKTITLMGTAFAPPWSAGITFFRDPTGTIAVGRYVFSDGSIIGINYPIDVPNGGYYWQIDRLYVGPGTDNAIFDLSV